MPVTKARVRKIALSFENAIEVVHVDRPAFRTPRKIFATLPPGEAAVNLMFDPPTQEFFCEHAPEAIEPLPGGWGRMGMSRCDLNAVDEATLVSALKAAYGLANTPRPKRPRKRV
jgi:hypothetical protein